MCDEQLTKGVSAISATHGRKKAKQENLDVGVAIALPKAMAAKPNKRRRIWGKRLGVV